MLSLVVYSRAGWISWGDWLGTGTIAKRDKRWRRFEDAREFARRLKLRSREDWWRLCRGGARPKDIPFSPDVVYGGFGWVSWSDFLGSGAQYDDDDDSDWNLDGVDEYEAAVAATVTSPALNEILVKSEPIFGVCALNSAVCVTRTKESPAPTATELVKMVSAQMTGGTQLGRLPSSGRECKNPCGVVAKNSAAVDIITNTAMMLTGSKFQIHKSVNIITP